MPRVQKKRREFTAAELERIKSAAYWGLPDEKIALLVESRPDTFKELKAQDETLRHLIDSSRTLGDTELVKTAHDIAIKDRNISMITFLLARRCGFVEPKQQHELLVAARNESFEDYVTKLEQESERTSQTIEVETEQADSGEPNSGSSLVVRRTKSV